MATKKIRYLIDGPRDGNYVRCWKARRDFVVQVWLNKQSLDGEPDGDWEMPGVLGMDACISQAVTQTAK